MEQKLWFNSTTIRGALITILPVIALTLKALHVDFGGVEQQSIIEGVVALAGLLGTVSAIIGRLRAHGSQVVLSK